jgi:hypothetical protein
MQMVAEHMTPIAERAAWNAHLAGDHAELGRIVAHWIDDVREEQVRARAAKRMKELEHNEQEGE